MRTLSLILASGLVANVTLPFVSKVDTLEQNGKFYQLNSTIIDIHSQEKYIYNDHYVFRAKQINPLPPQKELFIDFFCNEKQCEPIGLLFNKGYLQPLQPRGNYGLFIMGFLMMFMKIFKYLGINILVDIKNIIYDIFKIKNKRKKSMSKLQKLKAGIPIHRVKLTKKDYIDNTLYKPRFSKPFVFVNQRFTMGTHLNENLLDANPNHFFWKLFNNKWYMMKKENFRVKIDDAENWNPNDYCLVDYGNLGITIYRRPTVKNIIEKVDMSTQTESDDYFFDPKQFVLVEDLHRGYMYVFREFATLMQQWGPYMTSVLHREVCNFQLINASSIDNYKKEITKHIDDIYCFYKSSPHFAINKHSFDTAFTLFQEFVDANVEYWFSTTKPNEFFFNPKDFIATQNKYQPFVSVTEYNKSLNMLQDLCNEMIDSLIDCGFCVNHAMSTKRGKEFLDKVQSVYLSRVHEYLSDFPELNIIKDHHYEKYITIAWKQSRNILLDYFNMLRFTYTEICLCSGETKIVNKNVYKLNLNSFRIGAQENLNNSLYAALKETDTHQTYDKFYTCVMDYLKGKASYFLAGTDFYNKIDNNDFNKIVQNLISDMYFTLKIKNYYQSNQVSEYYLDPELYKLVEKDGKIDFVPKIPINVVNIEFMKDDLPPLPFLNELVEHKLMKETEKLVNKVVETVLEEDEYNYNKNPPLPYLKELKKVLDQKSRLKISIPNHISPQLGEFNKHTEDVELKAEKTPEEQLESPIGEKLIDDYEIIDTEDMEMCESVIDTKNFNLM